MLLSPSSFKLAAVGDGERRGSDGDEVEEGVGEEEIVVVVAVVAATVVVVGVGGGSSILRLQKGQALLVTSHLSTQLRW